MSATSKEGVLEVRVPVAQQLPEAQAHQDRDQQEVTILAAARPYLADRDRVQGQRHDHAVGGLVLRWQEHSHDPHDRPPPRRVLP